MVSQNVDKEEYEIIVVNDGSPDNLAETVRRLQKEIANLILINQENQGVSMARNNAIAIAKGDFILPIDPDDYVEENSFGKVWEYLNKFSADCFFLKVQKINKEGEIVWQTDYQDYSGKVLHNLDAFHKTKGENQQMADPDRSWAVLYKKSLIDKFNLQYPKDVPFLEDGIFVAKFLSIASSYMLCNETFYWRTIREGSATNSDLFLSKIAGQGFINGLDDIYVFLNSYENQIIDSQRKGFLVQMYVHFCILPLIAAINARDFTGFKKQVDRLQQKVKKIKIDGLRHPYNIYGKTFFISPYIFSVLYVVRTFFQVIKRKLS